MAYLITTDCINCEACFLECPNHAIARGDGLAVIDPRRCTECVGHHLQPQCIAVCAVNCIVGDPNNRESAEELMAKYQSLQKTG